MSRRLAAAPFPWLASALAVALLAAVLLLQVLVFAGRG